MSDRALSADRRGSDVECTSSEEAGHRLGITVDFIATSNHEGPVFAQAGALCTYGPRLPLMYRRVAYFVARILDGARPADLPVERPSQFELILNQTTARAFNLTFSRAILARADEVIE